MAEEQLSSRDVIEALAECEEKVDHLKRENKLLREASKSFGALAERLNATLAEERRLGRDRRSKPRPAPDRRQAATVGDTP
jgi:hypothetical protein